jgi:hypothetical protein
VKRWGRLETQHARVCESESGKFVFTINETIFTSDAHAFKYTIAHYLYYLCQLRPPSLKKNNKRRRVPQDLTIRDLMDESGTQSISVHSHASPPRCRTQHAHTHVTATH